MTKRISPAAAAARLGVTVKRIYGLIAAKKLDAVNVSTGDERPRWRIAEEALDHVGKQQDPHGARNSGALVQ